MAEDELFSQVIAHYSSIEDNGDWTYPNSEERLALNAAFSQRFNLMRLGVHHERLLPGRRVSWPHAEADEEEFIYVLEGTPDLWLDGYLKRLKPGDGVGFQAGTGIAHTFINNSESDVRLLVVGEASRQRSRIHYPMNPKRNAEIGERHWKDVPRREMGPHNGLPAKAR
jgi:uncharacterized cupin superfamily protein